MATAEVFWTIHNIHAWRNCFRLVRFLPFENIQDFTAGRNQITDLHLIMALVKVNEGSRDVSTVFSLALIMALIMVPPVF